MTQRRTIVNVNMNVKVKVKEAWPPRCSRDILVIAPSGYRRIHRIHKILIRPHSPDSQFTSKLEPRHHR